MIEEAYVSFETAKLLKEKGFDELCIFKYSSEGVRMKAGVAIDEWQNSELDDDEYSCPSQAMAMKWLRKVHNLFIVIDRHFFVVDKISHIASGFKYSVEIKTIDTEYTYNGYKSYEDAVEAACIYSLKNLI